MSILDQIANPKQSNVVGSFQKGMAFGEDVKSKRLSQEESRLRIAESRSKAEERSLNKKLRALTRTAKEQAQERVIENTDLMDEQTTAQLEQEKSKAEEGRYVSDVNTVAMKLGGVNANLDEKSPTYSQDKKRVEQQKADVVRDLFEETPKLAERMFPGKSKEWVVQNFGQVMTGAVNTIKQIQAIQLQQTKNEGGVNAAKAAAGAVPVQYGEATPNEQVAARNIIAGDPFFSTSFGDLTEAAASNDLNGIAQRFAQNKKNLATDIQNKWKAYSADRNPNKGPFRAPTGDDIERQAMFDTKAFFFKPSSTYAGMGKDVVKSMSLTEAYNLYQETSPDIYEYLDTTQRKKFRALDIQGRENIVYRKYIEHRRQELLNAQEAAAESTNIFGR